MQYLMVLLVAAGTFVFMVALVLGCSYALGAFIYSRDGVTTAPAGSDPCAQCQADREWYEGLPGWKRNVVTAWWLANRYRCAANGCR